MHAALMQTALMHAALMQAAEAEAHHPKAAKSTIWGVRPVAAMKRNRS